MDSFIFKENLFQNKIALVSGGAQGIGKLITSHLLKADASVAVLDIDAEALTELKNEFIHYGEKLFCLKCDLSQEENIIYSINLFQKKFGTIDFLVNNVGISINKSITELSLAEWNKVISLNLTSIFILVKNLLPLFRNEKGAIVNLSSTRAFMSEAHTESYSASKGGIIALTHALAVSLSHKIRVNCISPGWIDVTNQQKSSRTQTHNWSEENHKQHPAGRIGIPQDIAQMVVYLLSDAAEFMTGENIIIDGGISKKMIYT